MSKQRLLVVGNGMVGHHFVEQLVNAGGLEQFDVTVLGAEPDSAYDRVHLSEVFGGRAPKELQMADPEWYAEKDVSLILSCKAESLDLAKNRLFLNMVRFMPSIKWCWQPALIRLFHLSLVISVKAAMSIAHWLIWMRSVMPVLVAAPVWLLVAVCWGWKRLTRCVCSGWKRTLSSSPRV